jgi:hypothetical protein
MQIIAVDAVDSVAKQDDNRQPLSKWRYTPVTLRLYRRLRRALFPGHRLDRLAKGASEALERCEQIGQCKID